MDKMCFKVVMVGDGAVGKTPLAIVFTGGNFPAEYIPTMFDNYPQEIVIDGVKADLGIWDTSGLEDYDRLRPLSYPQTDGFMIVFDITNVSSFENIAIKWLPEVTHFTEQRTVKLLVGNKCDLISERKVPYEKAEQFANKHGMSYIETSAKSGYNVEKAFEVLTRKMILGKKTINYSKLLQKNLDKAKKKQATVPVRFLRLFFTGSGAAGKTNFINLLLKKKFIQYHHSTNVVHTHHAVSVKLATFHESSDDKVEWIDLDSNLELSYLQSVLLPHRTIQPKTTASTAAATVSKHVNEGSPDNITTPKPVKSKPVNHYTPPVQQFSIKQWLTNHITTPVKGSSLSTFDSILFSNRKVITHRPGEVLNILTLLDTGSQPEYIHLLPTINIYPTVTFVIHDLSKSLSDQVLVEYSQHGKHVFTPYHLSYSNLDMIKLLMSAANDSIERPISNIPKLVTTPGSSGKSYICLVGTHSDQVSMRKLKKVEYKLSTSVSATHCEAAVWQTENGDILFYVNNATAGDLDAEDPVAKVIRKKIEKLAEKKEVYNLPITWMLLQLEIREVCSKGKKVYISFQDCVALARETGLMSKEKEIKSVLLYHHLLGVLIYFDKVPGLCDYVIVDHQWWFDKLSNIICTTFHQASFDHHAVKKLKYQGLLSKELLQHVEWKDDIKEEFFLSLLVHMRIIAPVATQNDKNEEYFIPYILPTYNLQKSNEILDQYGNLQGEPLLVQFCSGFLPRGLFCCLIVELLQHSPKGWEPHISCKQTHHTFSNVITFILPNDCFLSLLDKVSYLELQVRCLEKVASHLPVHVDVYNYLVYALTEVCIHLNFDYERLQYGFLCKCGEKPDNHIAIARLPTTSTEALHARCIVNNAYQLKMDPSQLVWFYCKQNSSDHANSFYTDNDQSKPSFHIADVKLDSLAEDNSNQPSPKRPAMRLLHEVVVPRIAADWSIVADYLDYEVEYKRVIKEKYHDDPVRCCVELLEDWLSGNRGVSPKSWSTLIEALRGIKSLTATTEKIVEDLAKVGVFV